MSRKYLISLLCLWAALEKKYVTRASKSYHWLKLTWSHLSALQIGYILYVIVSKGCGGATMLLSMLVSLRLSFLVCFPFTVQSLL